MSQRSGVTDGEFLGTLPGDDVIPDPAVQWTRGGLIDAPPHAVWPWLVQMGFGRGGWYTSELFDRIVWQLDNPSVDRILPEWQDLRTGEIVPDGPDFAAYFHVVDVIPEKAIVYHSIRHPYRGHPVDPDDRPAVRALEQRLRDPGTFLDFSWSWVLVPLGESRSRLLVRTRAKFAPPAVVLFKVPLGLVDFYHVETMLRGINRRSTAAILS